MPVTIKDLLDTATIDANLESSSKTEVIEVLSRLLVAAHPFLDAVDVAKRIQKREQLGSTGIGGGVAIPHCKAPGLDRVVCCFGRSVKGIDFESVDGKPAHLFFLLVAPEDAAGTHLEALKTISMLCHQPAFIERVMAAEDAEGIFEVMKAESP